MDIIKTDNKQNGISWQPGWDYLTDVNYYDKEKSSLWKFINFVRRNRNIYNITRALRLLFKNGPLELVKIFSQKWKSHRTFLRKEMRISKSVRLYQQNIEFPKKIKISIISVLNNTNEPFLIDMINSVLTQTYENWELCLADGSNNDKKNIKDICMSFSKDDNRIKYISVNTSLKPAIANKALKMTTGDYIGILDHNDLLHPSALYETAKVICKKRPDFIYTDEAVFSNGRIKLKHYKPDYAPDTLYSYNYIDHFIVFSRKLSNKAGKFKLETDASYYYELILRYTRMASNVYHIPKLLYFNRSYKKPATEANGKMDSAVSGINAIEENLQARGISAKAENKFGFPGFYRINYTLTEEPLVSIIIPNKDNIALLSNCLSSIIERTLYNNYEIIVVENNSANNETFAFYDEIKKYKRISVVYWQRKGFNFSEICNFGAENAKGNQFLFLNNDIMIISPTWIQEMLMYSQRSDVGVVGAKLYFLNGAIQHAGIVLGLGGEAGHIYLGAPYGEIGYMAKLHIVQNMSAVTGACMMIKKSVFEELDGFTPELYNSFNDVDLCLKARKKGYLVVWTPYAEAYHLESRSRGYLAFSKKKNSFSKESSNFSRIWKEILKSGDPYYNPNFSLTRADYSLID